jgi:hypothetical protein
MLSLGAELAPQAALACAGGQEANDLYLPAPPRSRGRLRWRR